MDGFRVVKLNEVIRQMDLVITCTGKLTHSATLILPSIIHKASSLEMFTEQISYWHHRMVIKIK